MCATREKGVSQLLLMLSMLAAGPAMAQGPIHVRFAPRVGIVAPDERLYARSERTASDLLGYAATLETSPSIGAALLVGSQDLGVFLHLAVDHAPSTDANLVVFGPPSDLAAAVTHRAVFPATLTEFGASMVLPMRLELGPFRPFATAGLGFTRYRFSAPESGVPVPPGVAAPESGTTWARRFGGGVDFELRNRGLSVAVVDAAGGYWGETDHRLIVTAEFWLDIRR
jgi:hypothetical protein